MEKVLIFSGSPGLDYLNEHKIDEVNTYLEEGWSVKSVTMAAAKDYTSVVFVLEKA